MLQSKLSYSQMGTFALAAYPYSMKLAWSPIVDALYLRRVGRRKSWIVPIQLLTAWLMIACAERVQAQYEAADVGALTSLFFVFVLLMATQVGCARAHACACALCRYALCPRGHARTKAGSCGLALTFS